MKETEKKKEVTRKGNLLFRPSTFFGSTKNSNGLNRLKSINYEKHAPRVSQVIATVAKVSCKHGLWLVVRVNKSWTEAC